MNRIIKIFSHTMVLLALIYGCKKEVDLNKLPDVPILVQPINGAVTGADTVIFVWQCKDSEGDDILYKFYISEDSTSWKEVVEYGNSYETTLELSSHAPENYYNYYPLKEGNKYYWKVKAENRFFDSKPEQESGESVSEVRHFYTTPRNVNSIDCSYNDQALNLSWVDTDDLDHVEITYQPSLSSIEQPIIVDAGVQRYNLTGLTNYSKYTLNIKAINNLGVASEPFTIIEMPLPSNFVVHDADFNLYNTITIGNQVWLTQNMKATHYNDGSPVGKYCSPEPIAGYGFIYDPSVAFHQTKSIAPKGFHIATDDDWKELEQYIGVPSNELDILNSFNGIAVIRYMTPRGTLTKCGKALASSSGWNDYNGLPGNGTDFYHLTFYPAGYSSFKKGATFTGDIAHILTSTVSPSGTISTIVRVISNQSDGIFRADGSIYIWGNIRCVKD